MSWSGFAVLWVALFAVGMGAGARGADKPNIVILLADDLGYADLGCQGCKDVPTPHIDSMAANGVRFTDGYATHCVCSPSRAGLMSGMYQHRFGFEHNSGPERYAAPDFGLPRTISTLAEKLKAARYATGMVGKWHIGFKEGLRPHERGFDYHFGFLSGAHTYLPGKSDVDPLLRNGQPVTDEKEYLTDAFAREAVAFIERSKGQPFFLYLAFNAVHSPLEATAEYERRFPGIAEPKRKTYAGMLSAMDDAVGRVLAKIRDMGQEENTLVLFYSDNGGPTFQTTSSNAPLRGFKGQFFEGGIRVPFLAQWKGRLPAGSVYREMIMAFDFHATALAAAGVPTDANAAHLAKGGPRGSVGTGTPYLDGVDLIPFLTGKAQGRPHEQLFWRADEKHAARIGDWKLVHTREEGTMLFDLKEDIGEQNDLAAKEPERLKAVQAAYDAWDRQMLPAKWVRQDGRNAEIGGKLKEGGPDGGARRGGEYATRIDERFKELDTNGDGKLSAEEGSSLRFFKQADADGDGALTVEEVKGYFRNSGSRKGKAQPAAP